MKGTSILSTICVRAILWIDFVAVIMKTGTDDILRLGAE
jgi:hypothetical protein